MIFRSTSTVEGMLRPMERITRTYREFLPPAMHIGEHPSLCGRFARVATLRIASMAGCAAPTVIGVWSWRRRADGVLFPFLQRTLAASHSDSLAPVVLALAIILAVAKLGGDAAERMGQPAVLGELVVGVLVGNLSLLGIGWFQFITTNATIGVLAPAGAVIPLFEVGLESTVRDMMEAGLR